jgi:hypothetical protein
MGRSCFPVLLLWVVALLRSALAPGLAADAAQRGAAVAIIDFSYLDTSGEARDQSGEHQARLAGFMAALKADLAAQGKLRIVVPACGQSPCGVAGERRGALVAAARAAGADLLLVGSIQKMSTLVQWAKVEAIDLTTEDVLLDKLFTFRGDADEAWRHAEAFIADQLASLRPRRQEHP